jgi:hypothetical protein
MFHSEKLPKCENINDLKCIPKGNMVFCKNAIHPHFFILIEDTSHVFKRTYYAFSYVPTSTYEWIKNKNVDNLTGYGFFSFTESHVVNSYEIVKYFNRIKTTPLKNWKFNKFPEFNTYNVLSSMPYCGITNCIGYSDHHFDHAEDLYNKETGQEVINRISWYVRMYYNFLS